MAAYRGPIVTTDVVCVRIQAGALQFLTIRREREPFAAAVALPGVYVREGETIAAATDRCLAAKASLALAEETFRRPIDVRDRIGRDPRGHAISIVTIAVAQPRDPGDGWVDVREHPPLAFDHDEIVAVALAWLRDHVWLERELLRSLVADEPLTTSTLVAITEAVGGADADPSNVRRRAISSRLVAPTGERAAPTGRGRPSAVWTWTPPER